jgi:dynein heavy chain
VPKFLSEDLPLFAAIISDLFPGVVVPYDDQGALMTALEAEMKAAGLQQVPAFLTKVIQLYETNLVRHGIMLSGPAGSGKTRISETLQAALAAVDGKPIKIVRMNPKSILSPELYGQTDPVSGEWVKGVFASIWEKYNNRELPYITWITEDGPVDAIWIEDL